MRSINNIGVFSEFPSLLAAHRDDYAGKTVVSFCTGGIRCEKAAIHMKGDRHRAMCISSKAGTPKYFEEAGGGALQRRSLCVRRDARP